MYVAAAAAAVLQIQAMAAMQDEFGPKSVAVLVTWVDGEVHFEVGAAAPDRRVRELHVRGQAAP